MPDIEDVIKEATQDQNRLQQLLNDSSGRLTQMEQTQANLKKGLMARFFPSKESKDLAKKIDEARRNVSEIDGKLSSARDMVYDLNEEKKQPQSQGLAQNKAELDRLQKLRTEALNQVRDEERSVARLKNADKNKSLKDKALSKMGRGNDDLVEMTNQGGDLSFRKGELETAKNTLGSFERKIEALQRKMDYRQNLDRRADQTVKNAQHVKTGTAAHLSPHAPGLGTHPGHHVGQ